MAGIRTLHIRSGAFQSGSALIAWVLWGLSVGLLTGLIPLLIAVTAVADTTLPEQVAQKLAVSGATAIYLIIGYLAVLACSTPGAIIITRQPGNRIGWIFCIVGLSITSETFAAYYACYTLLVQPGSLPGGLAAAWLQNWIWVASGGLLCVFLPLLFPNGRLLSQRWRLVGWLSACVMGALAFSAAVHTGALWNYLESAHINNPLGINALDDLITALDPILFVVLLLMMLLAVCSLVLRLRQAAGDERLQIKWFTYFGALLAVVFVAQGIVDYIVQVSTPAFEALWQIAWSVAFLGLPIAAGIAILKYHLYAIDHLINRTLVYVALTACVIGIYIVVVGYLGALFRTGGNLAISLLATGVVALLFQPLRGWFQRSVNRLLYGQRDEPYLVVTRLSQRVGSSLEHETILPTIVETVAQALKLPYAAIALQEGDEQVIAATYGTANSNALRLPLIYQTEPIGELILSPRTPGDAWTPADRRLLDELARQAGMAAHAVQLTGDLQRSRERLVLAREEERRRLRRDLHDGLGPTLGNLTLQLDAVDDLIESDPSAAHELVLKVKRQTQLAIGEIRRLVDDLRPPALDELGLITALREQAAHYNQLGVLLVEVDAPDALPSLPAAVEVAAYRIAVEGLRNAARHGEARRCAIQLWLDDGLSMEIVDDGKGLPVQARPGVGIDSMRERAAELGGTCVVETAPQGGVRVFACLPLPKK